MQQEGAAGAKVAVAFMQYAKRQIETGRFPETAALFHDVDPSEVADQVTGVGRDEERFESGLKALLDGAEVRMRSTGPPKRGRTRKKGA